MTPGCNDNLGRVASDQCITFTAAATRMRDLDVVVPCDRVATQSAERNATALARFRTDRKLDTPPGAQVRLRAGRS